jgi:hypothetical protein
MIDSISAPATWARFLAERDGTPFTPLTELELEQRLKGNAPDRCTDKLRGRGGELVTHHNRASAQHRS